MEHAEDARLLTGRMSDPHAREAMIRIAESYEMLATKAARDELRTASVDHADDAERRL